MIDLICVIEDWNEYTNYLFVCKEGIATITLSIYPESAVVNSLYVEKDARGKKIATNLLEKVEETAKTLNFDALYLSIQFKDLIRNSFLDSFYKKRGFQPYAVKNNEIFLRKNI